MKKSLAFVLAAGMAAISLSGCGGKTEAPAVTEAPQAEAKPAVESKAAEPSETEAVELKMFGFKTGAEEGAIPELIEKFNADNPDIKVVYEGISNAGGYQDVLTARLASGQGDDIFFANPDYLPRLQDAGYTEDLSDMPVMENYSALVKDLLTINGTVPGLGMEVAVFGLYSNTELLKEVGIEKNPTNYAEFMEACEILKNAGKTPIVAGAKDGTGVGVFSMAKSLDAVYQAPDKLEQIDKINKGELEFGQVMEPGFALVQDLISKGYLDGGKALVYAAGQDDIAEFAKGEVGFMPGGNWFVSGISKAAPDMKFEFGGIPVQEDDSLILINAGVRVCINSASEKKEAARRFVEYLTSVESMNAYVASQNSFNPRLDGISTENDIVAPAAERLAAARMLPWVDSAFDSSVVNPWADVKTFSANIAGGAAVADMAADLNTQVQNNLKLK